MITNIKINPFIPTLLSFEELNYLGLLAKSVPECGTIVEIGALYGASTWVLAKNAHPSVTVYTIDPWIKERWINQLLPKAPEPSFATFQHYTQDCHNIIAIQENQPDRITHWKIPIHLFFDNTRHAHPIFKKNMHFFAKRVAPGGIICGSHYTTLWPEKIKAVNAFASNYKTSQLEVYNKIWGLLKPEEHYETQRLSDRLLFQKNNPQIKCCITTRSGKNYTAGNFYWCGSLYQPDPITKISLTIEESSEKISLQCAYLLSNYFWTGWIGGEETFECPNDLYLIDIKIRLLKDAATQYSVIYQATLAESSTLLACSTFRKNGSPLLEEGFINTLRADIVPNSPVQ